ncbi:hypothetical protein F5J12DRAFT_844807 [Pisolithus orientalis]|uniref:uncharacterized protein n=1 Tax=Pisolithus orientalis TaxID=936130 RepID=UPI002224B03F|nr:uncharacterized protein F5J12DRAFT_844807 [Pisolithus orientalis]KAI6001074.1 hypothetical protein F5J12DRAFT_844807 [Pisolithus orientalis]
MYAPARHNIIVSLREAVVHPLTSMPAQSRRTLVLHRQYRTLFTSSTGVKSRYRPPHLYNRAASYSSIPKPIVWGLGVSVACIVVGAAGISYANYKIKGHLDLYFDDFGFAYAVQSFAGRPPNR